jgi:hypothetical protein
VTEGYDIILGIDANEGIFNLPGKYLPLIYSTETPISSKGHDGSLATLKNTCGLCDPLLMQNQCATPPPTYKRGKERIDYILVSYNILKSVTSTGILTYDSIFLSDHRALFIDFVGQLPFGEGPPAIAPPQHRGIQIHGPRMVDTYTTTLKQQIEYHKIEEKLECLYQAALNEHWDSNKTAEYESIDRLITEAMLHSERSITRKVSTTYHWSPTLSRAINNLRYWSLTLKKAKGQFIRPTQLLTLQRLAGIAVQDLPSPIRLPYIIAATRQARKDLKDIQNDHARHRENHLQSLAKARVASKDYGLLEPGKLHRFAQKTDREIKRIQRKENNKQMFRTVGLLLKPERAAGGLSKIDIPATATDEPYRIGPDPTTWEEGWKSITKPDTMANHICEANSRQYHQADATPFGKEPLRSYYGYTANTTEAHDLIRGTMSSTAVSSLLMRETVAILQTLSNIPQTLREPVSNIITESQFTAVYHIMEEKTSSSPSGRHIVHQC